MEKLISKRLKRSKAYNHFLELLEHYSESLQDIDFTDFVCVYNGGGSDFYHLISKFRVLVSYFNDEDAKYNDIWVYISANGNEIYVKAKEIDEYNITHCSEQIHLKYFDYNYGPFKEDECVLKYEKFGGPHGKIVDQKIYHYDEENNLTTRDNERWATIETVIDNVSYTFSGVSDDVIREIVRDNEPKKKKKER